VYHRKIVGSMQILVIACFAVACRQESPTPSVSSDRIDPNVTYPVTLAGMNGWHGIQVVRVQSKGRMNCSISFPPNFGVTKEERNLLIHMVAKNRVFREEMDCWISSNGVHQALNQLLRLVIDNQNPMAAQLLLNRGTTEMPFDLDGEVLEGYTESYQVPVLEKFEKLDTVLDQPGESIIAKSICADLQWREDIKDPVFKKRIQVLVGRLNAKGMGRFTREIESCDLPRPPVQ